MSDEIKELVQRLNHWVDGRPSGILLMRSAASALQAMAGEVYDLEARCETAEKERDRLKVALKLWQSAWATGRNEPMVIAANATKIALGGNE